MVDLGAQYMTVTAEHQEGTGGHSEVYADLLTRGLLRPVIKDLTGTSTGSNRQELGGEERRELNSEDSKEGALTSVSLDDRYWQVPIQPDEATRLSRTINYVAPGGVETIVNYFFNKSGVTVNSRRPLTELRLAGERWEASSGGLTEKFDLVVSTLPVPQLLGSPPAPEGVIRGDWLDRVRTDNNAVYQDLLRVTYNTVFTLGLFYDKTLPIHWKVKYLPKDPIIRYISNDGLRRGSREAGTCVCVQSQVSYGELEAGRTKQEVLPDLLAHTRALVPLLPSPDSAICHKWRYSQTKTPFPGSPGTSLLLQRPPLIAAGDSFSHSNVDGCLISAGRTCNLIKSLL